MTSADLPSREAIARELERLCDTDAMRRSPSHTRLLRHLVGAALAGDADALVERAIGIAVFRRDPAAWDPRTDPIVRVTTGRLRARLAEDYAALHPSPEVRIELPAGGYVPRFVAVESSPAGREGVAVLEARRVGVDESCAPIGFALSERLADALAALGAPRVLARNSVDRAERASDDPAAIARSLAVEWVVVPALSAASAGAIRVDVRLLRGGDGTEAWIESSIGPGQDLQATVDRAADRAVARFAGELAGRTALSPVPAAKRAPPEAEAAVRHVRFLLRQRSPASVVEAVARAQDAAARWPDVAATWAELANARLVGTGFMGSDSRAEFEAALGEARRALALDPDDVIARTTEGALVGVYLWDTERAIAMLRAVTRAAPRYSVARLNLAVLLQYAGAFDDALAELDAARRYEPLAAWPVGTTAVLHAFARRHEAARSLWPVALAAGSPPMLAAIFRGNNELWSGDAGRARAFYDEAAGLAPDLPLPELGRAMAEAAAGDRAAARARVDATTARHPRCSHFNLAMVAAELRDRDGVLEALERAAEARDPLFVSAPVQPSFDWLARDRSFNALLREHGLPGWRGAPAPDPRRGPVANRHGT